MLNLFIYTIYPLNSYGFNKSSKVLKERLKYIFKEYLILATKQYITLFNIKVK